MKLSNVGLPMAEVLFKAGYASLLDIMDALAEDVAAVMEIEMEDAVATIQEAVHIVQEEQRLIQQEAAEEAAMLDAARGAEIVVDESKEGVPEETQEDTDTDGIAD